MPPRPHCHQKVVQRLGGLLAIRPPGDAVQLSGVELSELMTDDLRAVIINDYFRYSMTHKLRSHSIDLTPCNNTLLHTSIHRFKEYLPNPVDSFLVPLPPLLMAHKGRWLVSLFLKLLDSKWSWDFILLLQPSKQHQQARDRDFLQASVPRCLTEISHLTSAYLMKVLCCMS